MHSFVQALAVVIYRLKSEHKPKCTHRPAIGLKSKNHIFNSVELSKWIVFVEQVSTVYSFHWYILLYWYTSYTHILHTYMATSNDPQFWANLKLRTNIHITSGFLYINWHILYNCSRSTIQLSRWIFMSFESGVTYRLDQICQLVRPTNYYCYIIPF